MCCPMMSAWDLHKAWPEADLKVGELLKTLFCCLLQSSLVFGQSVWTLVAFHVLKK